MELMKLNEAPGIELWCFVSVVLELYIMYKNIVCFYEGLTANNTTERRVYKYLLVIDQSCCIRISFNQLHRQEKMNTQVHYKARKFTSSKYSDGLHMNSKLHVMLNLESKLKQAGINYHLVIHSLSNSTKTLIHQTHRYGKLQKTDICIFLTDQDSLGHFKKSDNCSTANSCTTRIS